MPEDISLESHEHREHAEHAAHSNDAFLQKVSITIAVLAVAASMISSVATSESAAAIAAKNDAVLHQNMASYSWAFFQAKTIKEAMFALAADANGPNTAAYRKESARHQSAVADAQTEAKKQEQLSRTALEAAKLHEGRERRLSMAEAFSHIAIAIGTIAIVLRRRWPWLTAIGIGAIATLIAGSAFLL